MPTQTTCHRRFSALVLCALSSLAISVCEARNFRSAEVHPNDYPTTQAVRQMGKLLGEQSSNRLGIKVYPAGSLGTEKDNIEQLKIGGLDMMRIYSGALNSVVPETLVIGLPYLFRSTEHMHKVLDGPIGDEILASMQSQGLVGLAFYDGGARSFYTVKRPINSLADLKGMKIRVPQSDLFVGLIQSFGASPTPMPLGEVYTAMKTGIVDGAENNVVAFDASRHFEAAKFFSLTDHSMAPDVLVFSKKVWDTLPAADQQLIRKAAKDSVPFMRGLWTEREKQSRKKVEAAGVRIVTPGKMSEFSGGVKPLYDKFLTTPKLKELVKRIQDVK